MLVVADVASLEITFLLANVAFSQGEKRVKADKNALQCCLQSGTTATCHLLYEDATRCEFQLRCLNFGACHLLAKIYYFNLSVFNTQYLQLSNTDLSVGNTI